MSYTALVVKVMIASPSDVPRERQLVRDVIHEWNAVHAEDRKVVLMPVGWELTVRVNRNRFLTIEARAWRRSPSIVQSMPECALVQQ
jgi:hypothetical protein